MGLCRFKNPKIFVEGYNFHGFSSKAKIVISFRGIWTYYHFAFGDSK